VSPDTERQSIISNVLAVVLRVAGGVITDVRPHAIGRPGRQVTARIGHALLYRSDPRTAGYIRQKWDASQYLAFKRLPEHVSQTWLAPEPDTYPLGIALRLADAVRVTSRWVGPHLQTRTPAHMAIRVDRLIFQV
jgi:hypothetical protein